jgi:hypothetical protein
MQFLKLFVALTCLHINNSSALQLGQEAKIQEGLKEKSLATVKGSYSDSVNTWLTTIKTNID